MNRVTILSGTQFLPPDKRSSKSCQSVIYHALVHQWSMLQQTHFWLGNLLLLYSLMSSQFKSHAFPKLYFFRVESSFVELSNNFVGSFGRCYYVCEVGSRGDAKGATMFESDFVWCFNPNNGNLCSCCYHMRPLGMIVSKMLITEAFSEDAILWWRPWRQCTDSLGVCISTVIVMLYPLRGPHFSFSHRSNLSCDGVNIWLRDHRNKDGMWVRPCQHFCALTRISGYLVRRKLSR